MSYRKSLECRDNQRLRFFFCRKEVTTGLPGRHGGETFARIVMVMRLVWSSCHCLAWDCSHHSFIHYLVFHSFTHSFIISSFIYCLITRSLIISSCIHSLTHLLSHHSLIHSLPYRSLATHSFNRCLMCFRCGQALS